MNVSSTRMERGRARWYPFVCLALLLTLVSAAACGTQGGGGVGLGVRGAEGGGRR